MKMSRLPLILVTSLAIFISLACGLSDDFSQRPGSRTQAPQATTDRPAVEPPTSPQSLETPTPALLSESPTQPSPTATSSPSPVPPTAVPPTSAPPRRPTKTPSPPPTLTPTPDTHGPFIRNVDASPSKVQRKEYIAVSAMVSDPAGIFRVHVHWKLEGGTWEALRMTSDGGETYQGVIPAGPVGFEEIGEYRYYVRASDLKGNYAVSPNYIFLVVE